MRVCVCVFTVFFDRIRILLRSTHGVWILYPLIRSSPQFPSPSLFFLPGLVAESGSVVLQNVPHSGYICFLVVPLSIAWISWNWKLALEAWLASGLAFFVALCDVLHVASHQGKPPSLNRKILWVNTEFGLDVVLGTLGTTEMNKV